MDALHCSQKNCINLSAPGRKTCVACLTRFKEYSKKYRKKKEQEREEIRLVEATKKCNAFAITEIPLPPLVVEDDFLVACDLYIKACLKEKTEDKSNVSSEQ